MTWGRAALGAGLFLCIVAIWLFCMPSSPTEVVPVVALAVPDVPPEPPGSTPATMRAPTDDPDDLQWQAETRAKIAAFTASCGLETWVACHAGACLELVHLPEVGPLAMATYLARRPRFTFRTSVEGALAGMTPGFADDLACATAIDDWRTTSSLRIKPLDARSTGLRGEVLVCRMWLREYVSGMATLEVANNAAKYCNAFAATRFGDAFEPFVDD